MKRQTPRKLSPTLLLALVFIVMAVIGLVLGKLLAGVDFPNAIQIGI